MTCLAVEIVVCLFFLMRTWLLKAESLSFFPKVSNSFITISLRSDMFSWPRAKSRVLFFFASERNSTEVDETLMTKQTPWQGKDTESNKWIPWRNYYFRHHVMSVVHLYKHAINEITDLNCVCWCGCFWWLPTRGSCCGIHSELGWPAPSWTRSTPSIRMATGLFLLSLKLEWNSNSEFLQTNWEKDKR